MEIVREINNNSDEYWRGVSWVRERFLGKGGYGSVFLVKRKPSVDDHEEEVNGGLPSVMAMKIARMAKASNLKYEQEILCSFNACPYVIRCYGGKDTEAGNGSEEKGYSLFLEFCTGGNLYERISKFVNGLPEHEVRSYTRDIVRGLEYIHGNGIVHCDIKPANILLVPEETGGGFIAKLADFGMAKNVDYTEEKETSDSRGTFSYMSPELVKERLLTYPADVWALGCVVVEMMSGKSAWGCEFSSADDLLHHIAFSSEVPEIPDSVSEEGKDFLSKCFIRNFYFRWTAEQLLEHPFLAV
ncbi:Protein kinase-like protein [Melia azedarach]|uniref:Protein kinase-like protein n=1 Tax=Melia azedarach TaxID=155640 RepID=A0ACC1XDT0_MELAZ|nr:Protein kinase-like protein [Melia azedarach]